MIGQPPHRNARTALFQHMNARAVLFFALSALLTPQTSSHSPRLEEADALFRSGRGHEALDLYRTLVSDATGNVDLSSASRQVYAKSLAGQLRFALRYGDHPLAEKTLDLALAEFPSYPCLLTLAGRYASYRGDIERAKNLWTRAIEADPKAFEARFALLSLEEVASNTKEEPSPFYWFLDRYREETSLSPEDLEWVGRACVRLGKYEWDGAQKIYQEALDASPELESILVAKGDLWLDRYDEEAAVEIYASVRKNNPESLAANLGVARAYLEAGKLAKCKEALDRVLSLNPNHPEALAYLADLLFYDEEDEEARECIERGFATNPHSIHLLAIQAAYFIKRNQLEEAKRVSNRVRRGLDSSSEFHFHVATCLERNYQFRMAEKHYLECLKAASDRKRPKAALAILRSRISPSSAETALEHMRTAFKEDPFHIRLYNMRNLFAKREEFARLESEHFLVRLPPDADWVYGDAVLTALEENFADLSKRFTYRPQEKILVEFYEEQEDLFLRISGLPGRGLSGVCFGDTIVMRGPAKGMESGLNWGNVMRHELTHVFTLGATAARIPRWYTEGLSVSEEWDPGISGDPFLWKRLQMNDLIPIEEMDAAFHRPKGPHTVWYAYAASGEAVRYLTDTYGFTIHNRLMDAFSRGKRTPEVLSEATGNSVEDLNREVTARIRNRVSLSFHEPSGSVPAVIDQERLEKETATRDGVLRSVKESLTNRKWESAFEDAEDWLQANPDDPKFLEAKARAAYELGQKRETRKAAEAVLSVTSESDLAYCILGWLDRDYRRWDRAVDRFLRAHRIRPRFVGHGSPIRMAEEILRQEREWGRLCDVLAVRLAADPKDADGYRELARLALDDERLDLAKDAVRQAVYLQPFDSETQILWGTFLTREGNLEEGMDRFEAARKLDPASGNPELSLAKAYLEMGSREAAVEAARKALELDPTLDEARDIVRDPLGTGAP